MNGKELRKRIYWIAGRPIEKIFLAFPLFKNSLPNLLGRISSIRFQKNWFYKQIKKNTIFFSEVEHE